MTLCECGCGAETKIASTTKNGLIRGKSYNRFLRGHRYHENSGSTKDMIGKKFGMLTVLRVAPVESCVVVKCDCGKEAISRGFNIRIGHKKSCGCAKRTGEDADFQRIWGSYKYGAKRRGLEISLTREEAKRIMYDSCYYCGIQNSYGIKTLKGTYSHKHNGIDRINNTKGYTVENSRPCCFRCNQAKSSMTEKEFFDWIKSVYEVHRGSF